MKKFVYTFFVMALFGIVSGQTGKNWHLKIDGALYEKTQQDKFVPFLIILTKQADLSGARQLQTKNLKGNYVYQSLVEVAQVSQKDLTNFLKQNNIPYHSLFIINAIKAEGSLELINALAQRNDVAAIIADPVMRYPEPVEKSNASTTSRSAVEWGIERINADDVWALGYRGQGVVVGGEDTGYEWTHPALKKQYRGYDANADTADHNYNWHDAIHTISPLNADSINPCGLDSKVPCDDTGHGTHTMGTMIGLDSTNEIGVAPEAKWCGCRNMERGWGTPFTYLECFQWFLAPTDLNNQNPDPTKAPHVINNSWTCPRIEGCDSSNWEVLNQVVNILRLAGIVVVASAGNSGPACSTVSAPAAMFEGAFSVGATSINDTIANFSSRGPVVVDSSFRLKPNVAAPGVLVRSARLDSGYVSFSGTSMAGPHVAGLVALIISANPSLAGQVEIIEDIIEQTSVPKTTDQMCGDVPGSEVPNNTYGYGRVDALAAVEAALELIEVSTKDENVNSMITVFPNPAHDHLYIDFSQPAEDFILHIYDMHGRLIYRLQENGNSPLIKIDLTNHTDGIFFYKILQGENIYTGKFVKQ